MVGRTLLHYRITKELGKGGMGVVYKADDLKLHRTVALKVLLSDLLGDERARKRFLREARAASSIDHPNICTVYEINESPDLLFFVMQYVEGETLKKSIGGRPMPIETALDISLQLADALVEAHSRNVIHRDIKSSNIVMTERGQPKILDFGLAKFVPGNGLRPGDEAGGMTELTQKGIPFGTASYMSPEQARGEEADKRSDLYSLGVVIYEMIAGRLPYRGKTSVDVMHAVLHDAPAPLPANVPAPVVRFLDRALAKDPNQRFQSAGEFLNELRRVARQIYAERGDLPLERQASLQAVRPANDQRTNAIGRAFRWVRTHLMGVPDAAGLGGHPEDGPHELTVEGVENSPSIFGGSVTAISNKRAIAILPFKNLSGDPESNYYGFSLADAVITELAQLKSLIVRPSSYIAKYQNQEIDPAAVGRELAVDAVVIGGFLKAGDRFRLTPQLIDIDTGQILWTDKIDLDAKDIITLQDTISRIIADQLRVSMSEAEQDRLARAATTNHEAYELYLKGRTLLYDFITHTLKREDLDEAVDTFRRAVAIDPNYALAHSALGVCLATYVMKGMGGTNFYDEAEASLKRALELDPSLIEARVHLVYIYLGAGEKQQARELVEKLRREAPNNATVRYIAGTLYRLDGMYDEALREWDRQLQINPTDIVLVAYNRARIYMYRGEHDRAITEIEKGLAVEPDHPLQKAFLARIRYYQGNLDEAALLLEDVFEKAPSARGLLPILGIVYSARGEHARAMRFIDHDVIDAACADHDIAYWLATLYVLEEDYDEALTWLERAADLGNENFPWFARDPSWDRFREDPRYRELIARLKERRATAMSHS